MAADNATKTESLVMSAPFQLREIGMRLVVAYRLVLRFAPARRFNSPCTCRRRSRRAFRVHLRGTRAGEQIALAGRVVGCLRYRGNIALVRAIALFERQA